MGYRSTSYWFDSLDAEPEPRPPLPGDLDVDVVVLGAGFTGLWTAYYLRAADPSCRVAVIERDTAGFGASGRNGGWCEAMLQGLKELCARDPQGVAALREALVATVSEIGSVCHSEAIAADFHPGGGLVIATDEAQAARLREAIIRDRAIGWTEDDVRWLEADEVRAHIRVASTFGATFHPRAAAVHPAKLARGLADAVERRGATIYEQTEVTGIEAGRVRTSHGSVRAPRILIALNAHTTELPGRRRDILPIHDYMFATEPFSDQLWAEIGLAPRGLFGDFRRLFFYAQRTADNRIAIGGRIGRYHYGSGIDPRFDRNPRVERMLVGALRDMLPQLGDFAVTHRWGGVEGVPRDQIASASFDTKTGIARFGSYTGEGVCASNLAGRTLCDLLLGRETPLTALPWVGHRSPRWEPEPLRWIGVQSALALCDSADRLEARSGRRARVHDRILHGLGMYN
jgi:glycine/D-amino acid oxidase-like deaminating enzyme